MLTTLLVVGILVFLIVIHELGHFVAAKLFRVHVEEFGVGYPPRAFLITTLKGTQYTLNWIPFGGFVRLLGENADAPKEKGSFSSASRPIQALILIAGVFMNALAAWLLFAGALYTGIPHVVSDPTQYKEAQLIVGGVVPGSPADSVGMISGDRIVKVVDPSSGKVAGLTPPEVIAFVSERGGKPIAITTKRGEVEETHTVRPAHSVVTQEANRPALGVGLVMVTSESVPVFRALVEAVPLTWQKSKEVGNGLWGIIEKTFSEGAALEGVVGPVGLYGVVGEAAQHGTANLLALAGFISINLVIVNLIPIPALDGGRLLLVGIESVIRRASPRIIVAVLNGLGIAAIATLMIAVTYNDIVRLFA